MRKISVSILTNILSIGLAINVFADPVQFTFQLTDNDYRDWVRGISNGNVVWEAQVVGGLGDHEILFNDGNSTVFSFGNHSSVTGGDVSPYGPSQGPNRVALITTLVMFVGAIGASIFIGYGIKHATLEQQSTFNMHTDEIALELELTLAEYERAGKWLHQACSKPSSPSPISRQEFHKIYQYI